MTTIRTASGFTLIELLAALVMISILGMGAVNLFVSQHQAFVAQNDGVRASANARAGFELLSREARSAGYDPRGLAGAAITTWAADTFAWTADLNEDGDLDDDAEVVSYHYDSAAATLVRTEAGTDVIVVENLTDMAFSYFSDGDGTAATAVDEIAVVGIRLEFDTPDDVPDGRLETRVALRNPIFE